MIKYLFLLLSLTACSTTASIDTNPNSIYINSPDNLANCKFLGVVETKDVEAWENDLRKAASLMGATHIQSKGPNYVGFDEIVSGHAYKCK